MSLLPTSMIESNASSPSAISACSRGMRESVLASIIDGPTEVAALHTPGARQALESVAATIDDADTLTTGERILMRELLARLAGD
jgi:hypothetical protein